MLRTRRRRNERVKRGWRRRPHDMWEPDDYDFPDNADVEDWMIAQTNGEQLG